MILFLFLMVIFFIMFGLKLSGQTTLSWWVVTAPLWFIPVASSFILLLALAVA